MVDNVNPVTEAKTTGGEGGRKVCTIGIIKVARTSIALLRTEPNLDNGYYYRLYKMHRLNDQNIGLPQHTLGQ